MPRLQELSTMSVAVMSNNVVFERIRDETTKGAMLTMLAEVASQALLASDEDQSSSPSPSQSTVKKKRMREITVEQALSLSTNHLLRIFARFEGDEMKRSFSYECLMIPTHCSARFSSFGSESKARHMIREHLHTHLYCLNPGDSLNVDNKEDFNLKKLTNTVPKTSKKCKLKYADENPEILQGLQNELYFKNEVQIEEIPTKTITINSALTKCLQNTNSEDKLSRFDHNYHRPCASNDSVAPSLTNEEEVIAETLITEKNCLEGLLQDQFWDDMPVVAEEVIKTEIRVFEDDDEEEEEEELLSTYKPRMITTKTIKSEDLPVLQDNRTLDGISALVDPEAMREYMHIERDEHRVHKKPKGKAKFIGQSAAEKEMAVRMIETMKLKQGSGEPLECQICIPPRVFTAPTTLISHYRSHAGIKPYECHLCGSVFTRQHSLNYHLLIHSNKTRFTCEDCGRKFRHPSHFKEHQRRHTGEAPFECSDCMSRFKTRNTYKRHLKTRHGKVLTQSGGIIILSDEEFRRVRTSPRSPQTRIVPPSNDKENNRRIRGKVANILRRGKSKKNDIIDDDVEEEKTEKCIPTITHWNSENVVLRDVDSSDVIFEETTEDSIMDTSESIVNLEYGEFEENIPTTVMLVATATFPSNVLNDSLNT